MQCHHCHAEIEDSAILCDACGAVVKEQPVEERPHTKEKHRRANLRRYIAIGAALTVILVGIVGVWMSNTAEAVATRYVQASMEGDLKATMSLCVGDMRAALEKQTTEEQRKAIFQNAEVQGEQLGLELSIHNFSDYYKAMEAIVKETYTQAYGEGYKLSYKVRETEDMTIKEFDAICDAYANIHSDLGVDTDRLQVGKNVTVTITVDGKDGVQSYDRTICLVKYKGAWKVVPYTYVPIY